MDRGRFRRCADAALLALLPFLLASGSAEPLSAPTPTPVEEETAARIDELRHELDRLLPVERWRQSLWGVLVTSLDRGDTLYAMNAHQPLSPASNVKLLTSAAAFHHLGAGYRFRTFLLSDGTVQDSTLRGDLVLYGTGDPSLGDRTRGSGSTPFREMARRLRERGIRVIDGDVVGDGTYFAGPLRPAGWRTQDPNDWFAAPVGALQYNENLAMLRIRSGSAPGTPVRVETIPESAPIAVRVEAQTVSRITRHRVWALRDGPGSPVSVTGQIRVRDRDVWRRMTVDDPALYAARSLRRILRDEGITVRGRARSLDERRHSMLSGRRTWAPALEEGHPLRILAQHESPPLVNLLWVVNQESHNLFAESILRTLGRVVAGNGTFETGAAVVRDFLTGHVGVPPEEARPVDGSGLSPTNRVSTFAFVRVLDHMSRTEHWPAFWSTLPQAGNWRELRRMYRSPAAENLRAKTGTIRRVSALSGVVQAGNGERLAFSVVSNAVPSTSAAKRVEDRIGIRLASFWRPSETPAEVTPQVADADDDQDQ